MLDGLHRKRSRQRNRIMNMGAWNTKQWQNKMVEVIWKLKQMTLSIAVVTHTKKGQIIEQISKYIHIFNGVPRDKITAKSISILIDKNPKKQDNRLRNNK